VINYTEFLDDQIKKGKLKLDKNPFENQSITYHDPCYLGRGNKIYDAPRNIVKAVYGEVKEMKRCKSSALCCGAGGAQMFKDAEKGDKEVNIERTEDVLEQKVDQRATAGPF
jgi:Fe-S oxidoreductase